MRSLLLLALLLGHQIAAQIVPEPVLRLTHYGFGAPTSSSGLPCTTSYSCLPHQLLLIPPNTQVGAVVFGGQGSFYLVAASFDVAGLGCVDLGLPHVRHELTLPQSSLFTVAAGTCSQLNPFNPCGNWNSPPWLLLLTHPAFSGLQIAFQAAVSEPLPGGVGLALTNTVHVSLQ